MKTVAQFAPAGSEVRRRALPICLIVAAMTLLDAAMFDIALPSVQRDLDMSAAEVSWSVAGYALTFGLTLLPAGRLGDDYGRRRLLLVGLSLFAATAIVCGGAPDAAILIVGRLGRGIAAGVLAPQVISLMQSLSSSRRRGREFGYLGATAGLSAAIGPMLGAAILQGMAAAGAWRLVFYLPLPVIMLTLAWTWRALPADDRAGRRHRFDLVGLLVLMLGVLAMVLPALTGATLPLRFSAFALGVAALLLFVLWEERLDARGGRPLVTLRQFAIRSYAAGALIAAVFFAGFTGIFLVITLFLQQGLHYSPLATAASMLAFTAGSATLAVVSGRLVNRAGGRVVVLGCAVATIGLTAIALLACGWRGSDMAAVLAVPLFVAGCGCGLVIPANLTLTLQEIDGANVGGAAGLYETAQRVGAAFGTALSGALFFGTLAATDADYHIAAGAGLVGSAALVGLAFVISARREPRW